MNKLIAGLIALLASSAVYADSDEFVKEALKTQLLDADSPTQVCGAMTYDADYAGTNDAQNHTDNSKLMVKNIERSMKHACYHRDEEKPVTKLARDAYQEYFNAAGDTAKRSTIQAKYQAECMKVVQRSCS